MRKFVYMILMTALFTGIAGKAQADYAVRMGQAIVIMPGDPPAPPEQPQQQNTTRVVHAHHHGVVSHSAGYYTAKSARNYSCKSCAYQNPHPPTANPRTYYPPNPDSHWTYPQFNYSHD